MTTWGDLSRGVKGLSTNSDIFWIFPEPYLILQRNTSNKIDNLQVIRAFLQSPPTSSRARTVAVRHECAHCFPKFRRAFCILEPSSPAAFCTHACSTCLPAHPPDHPGPTAPARPHAPA